MPQGLEIFDSTGHLRFSTSDYTYRYLGQVNIPSSSTGDVRGMSGSINVPEFQLGVPVVFFQDFGGTTDQDNTSLYMSRSISINVSGTTLSWSWNNDAPVGAAITRGRAGSIVYGIM